MLNIKGGKSLTLDNVDITLPGFKHALVSALCNTVLFPQTTFHLMNAPQITDTYILIEILSYMGAECYLSDRNLTVNTLNLINKPIPESLSSKVHGALYLFPVLLARFGEATIGETGGCKIGDNKSSGSRPVEHIIKVMNHFGYDILNDNGRLQGKRLNQTPGEIEIDMREFSTVPTEITGPYISGATKTALLLAGSLKKGQRLSIFNPYSKPDVTELLTLLQALQYDIQQDNNIITIKGSESLVKHIHFELLGDLSVLMTYITLAVLYECNLMLKAPRLKDLFNCLAAEFALLQQMGVNIHYNNNELFISPPSILKPIDVTVLSTSLYSDHQPFFALMLTKASGTSQIKEFVWTNRFGYANELSKLGYQLDIHDNTLTIYPSVAKTSNTDLNAHDLRAAAVLLLAACYSKGDFILKGHEHLQRGYEDLIPSLTKMGAEIHFV